MAAYARTVEAARRLRDRAGANPLIVPAVSARGSSGVLTDPVLTPENAARVMRADSGGARIRKNCRVIFVTG